MNNTTKEPTNGDKPPKLGYHDRKIEDLEKRRRIPPPQPIPPHPPGTPPPRNLLSIEDRDFNTALDKLIDYWRFQKENTKGREGQLREAYRNAKNHGNDRSDSAR